MKDRRTLRQRLEDIYLRWHKGTIIVGMKDGSSSSVRIRDAWRVTCEANVLLQELEPFPSLPVSIVIGKKTFKHKDIWFIRCPNRGR